MPSKIEWTDDTWNPTAGCSRLSPGCGPPGSKGGCYAEVMAHRLGHPGMHPEIYAGLTRMTPNGPRFTGEIRSVPHRLEEPLRWRKPRIVFVNSMSDLFHENVDLQFVAQVLTVIAVAKAHDFLVLTKRSGIMRDTLNDPALHDTVITAARQEYGVELTADDWPLRNLWGGVSVESAEYLYRVDDLLETDLHVRFLSCEPLLGEVPLRGRLMQGARPGVCVCGHGHGFTRCPNYGGVARRCQKEGCGCTGFRRRVGTDTGIHWVIDGGMSGRDAVPMHPDWARQHRDVCEATGVAYFFKQWGEYLPETVAGTEVELATLAPNQSVAWGDGETNHVRYTRVGKKAAGRLLDGRTWDEMPAKAGEEVNHGA